MIEQINLEPEIKEVFSQLMFENVSLRAINKRLEEEIQELTSRLNECDDK